MKKFVVITAASVFFASCLTALAYASTVKIGYAVEDLPAVDHLTFGTDPTVSQNRMVIDIPQDYGKIIATFADYGGTVFWFESGDGQVRNLLVTESLRGPLVIHRSGKLE
jgi:hypothetical protein